MLQCLHDVRIVDISSNNIKRIVDYADIWNSVVTRCSLSWTNTILLTMFGDSRDRFARIVSPAIEKTLSDGTLVAGIGRIQRARSDRRGNVCPCCFHHCSRSSVSMERHLNCWSSRHRKTLDDVCLDDVCRFCVKRIPCASRKCWARFPVLTESL